MTVYVYICNPFSIRPLSTIIDITNLSVELIQWKGKV